MVTATKPAPKPPTQPAKKTDWVPIVGIGLGGAGLGLGLWLFLRKPPGVSPGDVVRAHFTFDYLGDAGDYVLLIRFGYHRLSGLIDWFDPEEGMDRYMLPVSLPGPDTYEFDVDCTIPDGAKATTYDAEGSILTPEMEPGQDWLYRVFKDKAITVRKE
jgi:hypothetical protein